MLNRRQFMAHAARVLAVGAAAPALGKTQAPALTADAMRPLGKTVMVKVIDSVSCRDRCLIQSV